MGNDTMESHFMLRFSPLLSFLRSMSLQLPTERDFDPYGGCLDAQVAWRNFGGLSLEEAYEKFASGPFVYQEDFMFMGPKAFAFYFPVINRYLCEAVELPAEERDDRQAKLLAGCIQYQFEEMNARHLSHLKEAVLDLCEFVLGHLEYYVDARSNPAQIERFWKQLRDHVREYQG